MTEEDRLPVINQAFNAAFTTSSEETRLEGGRLTLQGKVPSYYLKQLLQEAVRDIAGVHIVDNDVEVINPQGYCFLSGTHSIPSAKKPTGKGAKQ